MFKRALKTVLVTFLVGIPTLLLAASGSDLIGLGWPDTWATYFSKNLISVNGSGNVAIPVATGKKLSVTVAGTEQASVNATALTLPTDNLVVTTGTATIGGVITSPGLRFPVANEEAVAGGGSTVADAAALSATKHVHQLTGANGTLGWKFATSVAGQFEFLLNTTAGIPKIYAASGGTCNGGAADAACTLVTGIVAHICYSTAADTWICS